MKYFIGNWKMFGVPKSINILNKINSYYSKDKNRNKYRVIITPPYTLIESYSNFFQNQTSPARACVEVSALPKGGLVEIDCVAFLG